MHEAIHQQVLPSKEDDDIQCHHNIHQRIRSFLQERDVKHPSVEYQLCEDDTQPPTMASDRLFFLSRKQQLNYGSQRLTPTKFV